jgi:hypothetical protein
VFGRLGSRPFTLPEMQKLYLDAAGHLQTVSNAAGAGDYLPATRAAAPPRIGPVFRQPGAASGTTE